MNKILPWSFISCQVFWVTALTKPSLCCPKLSPGSGPAQDGEGKWGNQNGFAGYHTVQKDHAGDASRAFWHSFVPCQLAGPPGNTPASPRSSDGSNAALNPRFSRGCAAVEINLPPWTRTRGDGSRSRARRPGPAGCARCRHSRDGAWGLHTARMGLCASPGVTVPSGLKDVAVECPTPKPWKNAKGRAASLLDELFSNEVHHLFPEGT